VISIFLDTHSASQLIILLHYLIHLFQSRINPALRSLHLLNTIEQVLAARPKHVVALAELQLVLHLVCLHLTLHICYLEAKAGQLFITRLDFLRRPKTTEEIQSGE
jgi:hypothetical protein